MVSSDTCIGSLSRMTLDRDIRRIGRVELLEKADEFTRALAAFDVDTHLFDIPAVGGLDGIDVLGAYRGSLS